MTTATSSRGIRHPTGEPFCSVILMNRDGTGLRDLTGQTSGCEGQPAFTPDGQRIVFERYDDATNIDAIWSMDLTGAARHLSTTGTDNGVTDPNVSPDGRTLSFIAFNGLNFGQLAPPLRRCGSHGWRPKPTRNNGFGTISAGCLGPSVTAIFDACVRLSAKLLRSARSSS